MAIRVVVTGKAVPFPAFQEGTTFIVLEGASVSTHVLTRAFPFRRRLSSTTLFGKVVEPLVAGRHLVSRTRRLVLARTFPALVLSLVLRP